MSRLTNCSFLFFLCFLTACNTVFQPSSAEYKDYQIHSGLPRDTIVGSMVRPYRDSLEKTMNAIVGEVTVTLEKKQPEGSLGNFMSDAMLYAAKNKFGVSADAAFVNSGGIRLMQLPAGNVTRGKIFELMPFDNLVVLQKVKGSVLQEFLDHIAASNGWPVAGMTMQIKNKKAVNVLIGGQPLDPEKVYTIVNSDYVASGGDNSPMLKPIPQQNIGYLMRDALFDYINFLKSRGQQITARTENRVSYAQ